MSQTTDEDLSEDILSKNIADECVYPKEGEEQENFYDLDNNNNNNNNNENKATDEVIKYKKEIERISYLLKEKNLLINKLMIVLSNQTKVN